MQGGIVAVMRRKGGAVGEEEVEEVGGGGHKGEEDEDAPAGRGGRPRFWLGGGQGKHGAGGWVVEMEMLAPFVGHIVPPASARRSPISTVCATLQAARPGHNGNAKPGGKLAAIFRYRHVSPYTRRDLGCLLPEL